MTEETAIRTLIEARLAAVAARDAGASVRGYAPDIRLFDLAPPLVQPAGAARDPERARRWFETWDGPIATELSGLVIHVGGDVAFASGLLHLCGRRTDGSPGDFWSRTTIGLVRRDGNWVIVHEHNSFPMMMDGSGRAAADLEPER